MPLITSSRTHNAGGEKFRRQVSARRRCKNAKRQRKRPASDQPAAEPQATDRKLDDRL